MICMGLCCNAAQKYKPGADGRAQIAAKNSAKLRATYFSRPTTAGQAAVDETVAFLVAQEAGVRAGATVVPLPGDVRGGTCNVTYARIKAESTFRRAPTDARPYAEGCFALKARYHDAPACAAARLARRPPVWAWRFALESSRMGHCKMPDASPPRAAASFMRRRGDNASAIRNGTLTVVLLGLSFVGQPHSSLACLHENKVVDGVVYTARRTNISQPAAVSLEEIRREGGICGGGDRDHVASYYPAATHPPGFQTPRQNVYDCNLGSHSLVEYAEPGFPRVRVCYQYQFNMKHTLQPGARLPCGLDWQAIDVVLHLFPNRHFREQYLVKTGAPATLRAVVVNVFDVYQALLALRLRAAYAREGFEPPETDDLRPSPQTCDQNDVHYAMPGFADHAVTAWFSMIETGLGEASRALPGSAARFVGL